MSQSSHENSLSARRPSPSSERADHESDEGFRSSSKRDKSQVQNLKGFYVIEKILDKKREGNEWKYRIKWKDYPMSQCTWEPLSNLVDPDMGAHTAVNKMIDEFEEEYLLRKARPIKDDERSTQAKTKEAPKSNKKSKNYESSDPSVQEMTPPKMHKSAKNSSNQERKHFSSHIKSEKNHVSSNLDSKSAKHHHSHKEPGENSPKRVSSKGRTIFPKINPDFDDEWGQGREKRETNRASGKRKKPEKERRESSHESSIPHKKKVLEGESLSSSKENSVSKIAIKKIPKYTENLKKVPSLSNKPKIEEKRKEPEESHKKQGKKPLVLSDYEYKPLTSLKKKPNDPKDRRTQSKKGNFIYGDHAKSIISAKYVNDEIICELEWHPRPDGTKPERSSFSNSFIKEFDPLLLANFYESKITPIYRRGEIISVDMKTKEFSGGSEEDKGLIDEKKQARNGKKSLEENTRRERTDAKDPRFELDGLEISQRLLNAKKVEGGKGNAKEIEVKEGIEERSAQVC